MDNSSQRVRKLYFFWLLKKYKWFWFSFSHFFFKITKKKASVSFLFLIYELEVDNPSRNSQIWTPGIIHPLFLLLLDFLDLLDSLGLYCHFEWVTRDPLVVILVELLCPCLTHFSSTKLSTFLEILTVVHTPCQSPFNTFSTWPTLT